MEQSKKTIAYAGTGGAYAEIAAMQIFPGAITKPYPDFAAAYGAAESGECECAVLPLENSYAGDVAQVMDLAFLGGLFVDEVYELKISHCLLGVKGAKLADIKTIVSHQQALWQSAGYLKSRGFVAVEAQNTALAAEEIAQRGDPSCGVIASRRAAELFGLDVLDENINESESNTTRFAVFSKKQPEGGKNKFIMFFTVKNKAGSLGKAVSIIGKYGFNLRALKSRPTKCSNWEYYFYVEGDGDIYGAHGRKMLGDLVKHCLSIKITGCYIGG